MPWHRERSHEPMSSPYFFHSTLFLHRSLWIPSKDHILALPPSSSCFWPAQNWFFKVSGECGKQWRGGLIAWLPTPSGMPQLMRCGRGLLILLWAWWGAKDPAVAHPTWVFLSRQALLLRVPLGGGGCQVEAPSPFLLPLFFFHRC